MIYMQTEIKTNRRLVCESQTDQQILIQARRHIGTQHQHHQSSYLHTKPLYTAID